MLMTGPEPGARLIPRAIKPSKVPAVNRAKQSITQADFERFARKLFKEARHEDSTINIMTKDSRDAVIAALGSTVFGLETASIDMAVVQAVHLDPAKLAESLREGAPHATDDLDDVQHVVFNAMLDAACLHIVEFFTGKPGFVARTVVEQRREKGAELDDEAERAREFRARYREVTSKKLAKTQMFGLQLPLHQQAYKVATGFVNLTIETAHPWSAGGQQAMSRSTWTHLEDLITERTRVLMEGPAGSGKTTLLQQLTLHQLERYGNGRNNFRPGSVPFFLRLREFVGKDSIDLPNPNDFIRAVAPPLVGAMPGWELELLASGQALVLVDGVDEVPEAFRAAALDWVSDIVTAYPLAHYIITSRAPAVQETWRVRLRDEGFTTVRIEPMNRSQVSAFIKRWHNAAAEQSPADLDDLLACAASLHDALDARRDLTHLAKTPLLCAMICALHRADNRSLPRGRTALYERALAMLLESRDEQQGIATVPVRFTRSQIEAFVTELAFWMCLEKRRTIPREIALAQVEELLPRLRLDQDAEGWSLDAEAMLAFLMERSGVLQDPTMDLVEFRHPSMQDYLAAKRIFQREHLEFLLDNAHDSLYHDVAIMAVGQAQDDPERQNRILDGLMLRAESAQNESRQLWLLAAACIAEPGMVDPERVNRIRQETREFLPPRTTYEAEAAAKAGHFILDLLAELAMREHLTAEQAAATIHTASMVAVDDPVSVGLFRRFRNRDEEEVPAALVAAWHKAADPNVFAEQVLASADLSRATVTITDPELVRWLFRLKKLTRLSLMLPNSPHLDLVSLSDLAGIRTLDIRGPHSLDLAPLATLPNLGVLSITSIGSRIELNALAQVQHLNWLSLARIPFVDLAPLSGLRELTTLNLDSITLTQLSPIAAMPSITTMSLENLREIDLGPIGTLPNLTALRMTHLTTPSLIPLANARQVTDLELSHVDTGDRNAMLGFISGMSKLRRLVLDNVPAADLSPLAAAPRNIRIELYGMPNVNIKALADREDITLRRH